MIRNATMTGAGYRRRLGAADPLTLGIGVATSAIGMWMNSIQQSHNADTATTVIVDGLAQQLANLRDAYQAESNPTCADQRAALNAYDQAWQWLQSPAACGAPNFGRAGNACVADRAPGGKWPWKAYYRDPIANDPRQSGQACDTGQQVLLPSLQTGTYQDAGITSTGGSSTTGAPTTTTTPQNPNPFTLPTTQLIPGIPNQYLLFGALGLGFVLVLKS
jgi:hypothetical protein